jgi:hypothetical protein
VQTLAVYNHRMGQVIPETDASLQQNSESHSFSTCSRAAKLPQIMGSQLNQPLPELLQGVSKCNM